MIWLYIVTREERKEPNVILKFKYNSLLKKINVPNYI